MKIFDRLDNYLNEKEFKISIFKNKIHIINYDELIDFNNNEVSVRNNKRNIIIKGKDLVVSRMVEDEILVSGNVDIIKLK